MPVDGEMEETAQLWLEDMGEIELEGEVEGNCVPSGAPAGERDVWSRGKPEAELLSLGDSSVWGTMIGWGTCESCDAE